jgi:aryl-alcohol dehydrogenase-like predicted oxidoreductase
VDAAGKVTESAGAGPTGPYTLLLQPASPKSKGAIHTARAAGLRNSQLRDMFVDLQNITVARKFDFRPRKTSTGTYLIFIKFHGCILESPSHPYGRNSIEKSMQIAESVQTTTRQLGNSDLQITAIGFGAWAIGGGDWQFGWGSQDDNDSVAAIQHALDLGINWIDTAAVYGLGHSEEVVARALEGRQQKPYVFTKCTMIWSKKFWQTKDQIHRSLKRDSVRNELESSLRRLKLDVIDLYQIHWPDPEDEIEEGWETLAKLKQEGKVRYIGVSNFSVAQMERISKIAPITSLQPPYSMLNRGVEKEILPYCQQHNIGVINYSPMVSGLLTGAMTKERVAQFPQDDWRRNNARFQEPQLSRNLKLVELLREIGSAHGRSPGEVAIAWTLNNPAVTAAIVGARNAKQVDGIIGAATFRLQPDEIARIEDFLTANPVPVKPSK